MDCSGICSPWLCGLALRHFLDLRLYRQGIRCQHAESPVGWCGTYNVVCQPFRHQLSCVHAAVYSLYRSSGYHSSGIWFYPENSGRCTYAVLCGLDHGLYCLYSGRYPVMRIRDWVLLLVIAAAAVAAFRGRRKGCNCGDRNGCCGDCSRCGKHCD